MFLTITFFFASPAQAQVVTMKAGAQTEMELSVGDNLNGITSEKVILFTEKEGVVLSTELPVNLLVAKATNLFDNWVSEFGSNNESPLKYNGMITVSKPNPRQYAGEIETGTKVTSFLLHFNHSGEERVTEVASFAFDQPILGLIYDGEDLIATDEILGLEGVTYAPDDKPESRRTADGEENIDHIMVIPDQNAVIMYSRVGSRTDQVRVIVEAPDV
ncbi:MAG: hypothetical protein ACPGVO_17655 [Spirulinaceae cyanobacterium]